MTSTQKHRVNNIITSIITSTTLLMIGTSASAQQASFLLPLGSFIGETQFEATLEDANGCSLYGESPADWTPTCETPAVAKLDFEFQSENQMNLLILDVNKEGTELVQRDSFAVAQFDLRNPILTITPDMVLKPRTLNALNGDTAKLENQESDPNFEFDFSNTYSFVN